MTAKNKLISLSLFISFILTLFVSCDSFLRSKEVSQELERIIEYANAPKATITMRVDSSDYGDIYPQTYNAIKGEVFTVEFTQKNDVGFKYWSITNSVTGEEIDENVISIINEEVKDNAVERTIIRKISVKLNSLQENIEIRPKCFLTTETLPPELIKLNVAKTEQDVTEGTNLISFEKFTKYADNKNYNGDSSIVAANIESHHTAFLWIDVEGKDIHSGIDCLEVQETFIRKITGEEVNYGKIYSTVYELEGDAKQEGAKGLIKHNFKIPQDGVVKVTLLLKDKAGNAVSKELEIVKDTTCWFYLSDDTITAPKAIADDNNLFDVDVVLSMVRWYKNPYIKDLNGIEYKDLDLVLLPSDALPEISGYPDPIVKIDYSYDGENYIDCSADDINFEYEDNGLGQSYLTASFSIKANDLQDTIIRTVVSDSAGNERIFTYTLPKAIALSNVEVTNSKSFKFFFNPEYGSAYVYAKYIPVEGDEVINDLGSFSNGGTKACADFFNDDNSLKDGTYYFYLLRKKGSFYSRGLTPYIIYKNVTGLSSVDLASCSIPDFTYEKAPLEEDLSTGKRTVYINIAKPFSPNPGITYYIVCKGGANSNPVYYEIKDFNIPQVLKLDTSASEYTFNIMLMNKNNETKIDDENEQSVLLDDDTTPPNFGSANRLVFPEMRYLFLNSGTIDPSGLKDDGDGYMTIKYYTSACEYLEDIDWTDSSIIKEYKQPYSNTQINLPFDGEYGWYCYILLEDKKGNSKVEKLTIKNEYKAFLKQDLSKDEMWVTCDYDTSYHVYDIFKLNGKSYPGSFADNQTLTATSFYIENGEWKPIASNSNYYSQAKASPDSAYAINETSAYTEPYTWEYTYPFQGNETQSFIKTYVWQYYPPWRDDMNLFSDTVYFYPPYLQSLKDPSITDWVCNIKDYAYGSVGIYVMADKPCMAQTLYCSVDLGDEKSWLNGGIGVSVGQGTSTFTHREHLEKIPSGKYYTTVMIFADGDMIMTPVKYKN